MQQLGSGRGEYRYQNPKQGHTAIAEERPGDAHYCDRESNKGHSSGHAADRVRQLYDDKTVMGDMGYFMGEHGYNFPKRQTALNALRANAMEFALMSSPVGRIPNLRNASI